jgi:osmotically-inducible protein OsmY
MILLGLPKASSGRAADSAIAEAASQQLRKSGWEALHAIECAYRGGVLTLTGEVPSLELKQLAQSLVSTVEGIKSAGCIVNCIQVRPAINRTGIKRIGNG